MLRSVDVRLVEYFVAVVDHGGVTKAANALYIAQPSLSQAIKSLEREIGEELFARGPRTFELTAAGRAFEVVARRVTRDVEVARGRVEAVRSLHAGRLQIAAVADVTLHPLPGLVNAFAERYPDVQIRVSDPGTSGGVVAAVRQGDADLGLATLPVKTDSLAVLPLKPYRMVLAMSPELAHDLPDPVPQAMLRELPLIRSVDDRLAEVVADPDLLAPAAEAPLRSSIRQVTWELVMQGAGMALMPESTARSQLSGVEIRGLSPAIIRSVVVVYRPDQLSPAATAFLGGLAATSSEAGGTTATSRATSTNA